MKMRYTAISLLAVVENYDRASDAHIAHSFKLFIDAQRNNAAAFREREKRTIHVCPQRTQSLMTDVIARQSTRVETRGTRGT